MNEKTIGELNHIWGSGSGRVATLTKHPPIYPLSTRVKEMLHIYFQRRCIYFHVKLEDVLKSV